MKNNVIFILILLLFNTYAFGSEILEGKINQPINLSSLTPYKDQIKTRISIRTDGFKVIRFKVNKGKTYSLYINHPFDDTSRGFFLIGTNPFIDKDMGKYSLTSTSYQNNTTIIRKGPNCLNTHIYNIHISNKSQGNSLYLILTSYTINTKWNILLKSPAMSDKQVDSAMKYPFCSKDKGEYYIGSIIKDFILAKENNVTKKPEVQHSFPQRPPIKSKINKPKTVRENKDTPNDSDINKIFTNKYPQQQANGFSILIEAENEIANNVFEPTNKSEWAWRSRELTGLPHTGKAYWYLSRKDDWLMYIFEVPKKNTYYFWIKDYTDRRNPFGARAVNIKVDCKYEFYVNENNSNTQTGWGWHKIGNLPLSKGKHFFIVQKPQTTSAAAVIDSFYISDQVQSP